MFNTLNQNLPSTIEGEVTKIYFSDPDTDFYIFSCKDLNSHQNHKVKGYFFDPSIEVGVCVEVSGEWEKHPKYGYSLKAETSLPVLNSDRSVANYLSAQIKSLNYLKAHRLVTHFGWAKILDLLDNNDYSIESSGIVTYDELNSIMDSWRDMRALGSVAQQLTKVGIPTSLVKSIYSYFGADTVQRIQNNPYDLALVPEVPFPMVDKLALRRGLKPDSSERIASILEYMLEIASLQQGHLFLHKSELARSLNSLPSRKKIAAFGKTINAGDIAEALKDRIARNRVLIEGTKVYLRENFDLENESAEMLANLSGKHDLGIDIDAFIEEYERIFKFKLSDQQSEAIRALNENKVLLVTGGPGTGKTSVSKALIRLFRQANINFALLSPTGIAAKRLSSVVGEEARTIHRAYGFKMQGDCSINEDNPFPYEAVLVDETSMLDQNLLHTLLKGLKPETILVFVGDNHQLPSVGAGNVLHEMINSKAIRRVNLTQIFRQDGTSDIVTNAHRIKEGEFLEILDPRSKDTDFRFVEESDPQKIIEGVLHVAKRIFNSKKNHTFQVFSPTYKGPLGVDYLNTLLKDMLNPKTSQREISLGQDRFFREDDRIMVICNDYRHNMYNGEVGKIYQIDKTSKRVKVKIFDEPHDRVIELTYDEAKRSLMLSYAITAHKGQGQEYDIVILPFHEMFGIQLQRNLLYTAVTRAKSKVFIFGQWKALCKAILNDDVQRRNTSFAERLNTHLGGLK